MLKGKLREESYFEGRTETLRSAQGDITEVLLECLKHFLRQEGACPMRRRGSLFIAGMFFWACITALASESYGQASRRVRRVASGIAPVEIKAENQIQCTGKVLDADGSPIEGAAVKFYLFEYYTSPVLYDVHLKGEQTTSADGTFGFTLEEKNRANRWYGIVVAEKDAYALGWANWNASRNQEFKIKLTQAKELSGVVVDEKDRPIPEAKVSIYMLLVRDGNDRRYLTSRAPTKLLTTTTDSTGAFRFGRIPETATAEFCVQASGRATIKTFQASGYGGEDLRYKAGQADIKLVLPIESKIQGVVVDSQSGKPVAGVKLLALQERARPSFGQEPAISKADGTFAFGGLPPGIQYLTVAPPKEGLPEWVSQVVEITTEVAKTTSDVKIQVSKGGFLEVMVRDDENQDPVAGASVSIFQMDNGQRHSENTNAKGVARFRVPPGQYVVQYVVKEGYQRSSQQESATVEFDKPARVELQLRSTPKVTGVVRDPQGNPVEAVEIKILPSSRQDVRTDAEGRFSINWDKSLWGSRETTFCLVARHQEKNLAAVQELDEENTTLDVKLSEGITFTGKVVDPEGKGIAGADIQVMLRVANWGSSMDSGRSCQTDAEGKFQVKAIPPGNRFNLYARAQGYGRKNREVESDDAQEGVLEVGSLDLALANLTVTGTVVDVDDKPVADAQINTYGEGQSDRRSIKSDDQGKFTVDNVCAGRIRLSVYVRGERQLQGYVETEGGATDVKVVVSEQTRSTRFVPKQPPSLGGKTISKFEELNLSVAPADIEGKAILLCFWDMQQRPSRYCLRQLAQQQAQLSEKGVKVFAVQASQVEETAVQEWTEKYQISFPVSTISEKCEETCFAWGVRSLPWLILTDAEHIVRAEGFGVGELETKVKENSDLPPKESKTFDEKQELTTNVSSGELLHYLIEKNAEARKKISSASYDVEFHSELETKEGKRTNQGTGQVKFKGNYWWSTFENDARIPQTGWRQNQSARIILNDRYLGYWPSIGNAYAYQANHFSIETMTDENRQHVEILKPPDCGLLEICYTGFEHSSFSEAMKQHPDKIRWEAIKKNIEEENIFEIRRFSPYMHDPSKADAIWSLHGDKGFLVTERISFSKDGNIREYIKIDVKEVLPKIWFPIALSRKRMDQKSNAAVSFGKIRLNISIPEKQFEMEALGLSNDIEIVRTYQDIQKAPSLAGKACPALSGIQSDFSAKQAQGKPILVCFWDKDQRPSRRFMRELDKKADDLKSKGIVVIGVHAENVDENVLKNWLTENKIIFPVGIITGDVEETLFQWGVRSQPWLILTDAEHIVRAEGFGIEELDRKLDVRVARDTNDQDILNKMRSLDKSFLEAYALVVHEQTSAASRFNQYEQGQKLTKITVTSHEGAIAVEREISYTKVPAYRPKTPATKLDYRPDGKLIVWRHTRERSLMESDFQGHQNELMCFLVSPDGQITTHQGTPSFDFHRPTDMKRYLRYFRHPIWATGRGFANSLSKVTDVRQAQDGLISFRSSGFLDPRIQGTWQMLVDPNAAYLVRSASFTSNGSSKPSFVCTTSGTKWFNTYCLAERANIGDNAIIQQYKPEPDMDLLADFRRIFRGQLPTGTRVYDWRADPKNVIPYLVGEVPMSEKEILIEAAGWANFKPSLIGKSLPELKPLGTDLKTVDINDKMALFCFFDYQQRPSRHYLRELVQKAEALKNKGIVVVGVYASKVDGNVLKNWLAENKVGFPVGAITGDVKETLFKWGVRSQPWLILTDTEHIVRAEGFGIEELSEKIKESGNTRNDKVKM